MSIDSSILALQHTVSDLENKVYDLEFHVREVLKQIGTIDSAALSVAHDVDVLKEIAFKPKELVTLGKDIISYPLVTEKIVNLIISLYDMGEVDVYDSIAYFDLESLYNKGFFPPDYTPEFTRDCLRKARVTKRIPRKVRESLGWDAVPAYACALKIPT